MSGRGALATALLGQLLAARFGRAEPGAGFATVVHGQGSGAAARPGETQLGLDETRRLAGGLGDPLRALEALPAVARSPLGSGALILWGASPGDSRVLFLGMELPSLYHEGGLRTGLPAALLSQLQLLPASFGPEYGRVLGGLVVLQPRTLPTGLHAELSADLLDAAAVLSGSLGSRLRLLFGGRYCYLDRLLGALAPPGLGDAFALPQYYDAQAQAQLALGDGGLLRATFLLSSDGSTRIHGRDEHSQRQTETRGRDSYRLGLHYDRPAGEAGRAGLQLAPWLGLDRRRYQADFGGQPTAAQGDELLYGLRADYRRSLLSPRPRLGLGLRLGFDGLGRYTWQQRQGTLSRPARVDEPTVFGQSPGVHVNSDAWSVHLLDLALYAALSLRLGGLRIEPGLRLGATLSEVSRLLPRVGDTPPIGGRQLEAAAAPRLLVAAQPHPALHLSLAGGLYPQPAVPSDLSSVFGRPRLGLQRAWHVAAAGEWTPWARLRIEAAGYLRLYEQLVVASPQPTPPLAAALSQEGSGRSYGGQLLVRLLDGTLGRGGWALQLSGWLGYALSRSERRAGPGLPLWPSPYDQTHSLQATAAAQLGRLSAGLRLQYTTGLPRQPVLGSYYNAWADQYEPLLGPLGGTRLPDFLQLDLRLEYTFLLPAGLRLSTQLEVQNATHHDNVQELAYSADWQSAEPIRGLPTLAVLGLRVQR